MTRVNAEQLESVPWFAKAGAACRIVPIARFVSDHFFALKGGGYGCLFALTGLDEEALTDQELDAHLRMVEGAFRGLPEGVCLYQYSRVRSGFSLPTRKLYPYLITDVIVGERIRFLDQQAGFRRMDIHWCLIVEPLDVTTFQHAPRREDSDIACWQSRKLAWSTSPLQGRNHPVLQLHLQSRRLGGTGPSPHKRWSG